ncbi:hypothetical protein [Mesorhizobium sp. IMUNJ 23232]|uniref:hypothetical protein n=1 Tax=Mesorhizobium sp. IMUNJ 23232 TaxID=3376064 RepID=UPI0037AD3625
MAGLAAFVLTGAAGEHASRQDIDQCKLEASRTETGDPNSAPVNRAVVSESDPRTFEAVAACLTSKGYMRVQDIEGVCDDFILPQCFERN